MKTMLKDEVDPLNESSRDATFSLLHFLVTSTMHSSLLRRALASLQANTCFACSTSRRYSSKGSWEWRREKTPWRNVEAWNQEPRMYSHHSYNQVFSFGKALTPPKEPKGPKRPIGRPRKEQTSDLSMLLSLLIQPSAQYSKTLAPKEPRPKMSMYSRRLCN